MAPDGNHEFRPTTDSQRRRRVVALDADPARRALDAAVVSALGLDGELMAGVRRQMGMEPSVTGRRYGG